MAARRSQPANDGGAAESAAPQEPVVSERASRWVIATRDCFGPWKAPNARDQDFRAGYRFRTTRTKGELPDYIVDAPSGDSDGGVVMEGDTILNPSQQEHRINEAMRVLSSLDPANDAHWEENGAPNLSLVNDMLPAGMSFGHDEFRDMFPGFVRPAPI